MQKVLEFLQSPLFLNIILGVLAVTKVALKIAGDIAKKKAVTYAGEVVEYVEEVFKNSSNSTKLTRAIDLLRNKVLEKTPGGWHWLVNAALSTTVLRFVIESTITKKAVAEKLNEVKEEIVEEVKKN